MITRAQAETAASRAAADVKAAAAEIARVNTRAMGVLHRVRQAKANGDIDDAAEALRDADGIAQDMVRTRVRYQHAVEVANVVQSMANLKRRAEAKRSMRDDAGALVDDAAAEAAVEVLRRLDPAPPMIKLPPPSADQALRQIARSQSLSGLGAGMDPFATFNVLNDMIFQKLSQFGNWVTDNGPIVGGAVGTVIGAVVAGPPGAAAGGAAGTALGAMLKATKPQVVNQSPPPEPPLVANTTSLTLPQSGAPGGGSPAPDLGPPAGPRQTTPDVGVGPTTPKPQSVTTRPAFSDPTAKVASTSFASGVGLPLAIGGGATALIVLMALLKRRD